MRGAWLRCGPRGNAPRAGPITCVLNSATEHCRWHVTRRPLKCRGPARWPSVRRGGQPQPGTAGHSAAGREARPWGLNWGPRRSALRRHRGHPHHPPDNAARRCCRCCCRPAWCSGTPGSPHPLLSIFAFLASCCQLPLAHHDRRPCGARRRGAPHPLPRVGAAAADGGCVTCLRRGRSGGSAVFGRHGEPHHHIHHSPHPRRHGCEGAYFSSLWTRGWWGADEGDNGSYCVAAHCVGAESVCARSWTIAPVP